MPAVHHICMELRLVWWWRIYLDLLIFFCLTTGGVPDAQKVLDVAIRAMRWRIKGERHWKRMHEGKYA